VELTTIAKPYANAVFEIAQQNKSHADWKGVLEVGVSVANDATMRLASLFRLDIALNNARMLGNALMRPFFNNKSTNAFSCLLNALSSEEADAKAHQSMLKNLSQTL
jgi:F0F1-type ATP synthase delta subunit